MADTTALTIGTRVTTSDNLTGTVDGAPYHAASGCYVSVKWDAKNITASGSSNVAVENLWVI